jgi:hypothetical protein
MLPFGVTIPAAVPQGSEIPEGLLMNNPVFVTVSLISLKILRYSQIIYSFPPSD